MSAPTIWPFQRHFRFVVEQAAKHAFTHAGIELKTTVILVALSNQSNSSPPAVGIECRAEYISPDDFRNLLSRAHELYEIHPRSSVFHSDPWHHQRMHDHLRRQAAARAIAEMLNAKSNLADFTFHASDGAVLKEYTLYTCLGLESNRFEILPTFEHGDARIDGPLSLQHAIIRECLSRADAEIYKPDAGSRLSGALGSSEEILSSAAERFADYLVYSIAGMPNNLLQIMRNSTAQAYERTEAFAPLHIVNSRRDGYELRVPLLSKVPLNNARALRKLLEASESGFAAIADEGHILGLGNVDPATPSLDIVVRGKLDWTLSVQRKALLRSYAGKVGFPQPPLREADLAEVAERTVGLCNSNRIWRLAEAARDSGHGMTLVVASDAAQEAERLGPAAFVLEPCHLNASEVQQIGAIDGAVLIDTEGTCHAFGVILDGEATDKGDRARGSRFNSAIRYQRSHSDSTFVIVVSVDGGINLVPVLRPRVSRKLVAAAVDRFCDICSGEDPDGEDYAEAIDRVESYSFYLDETQCERVNQADEREQRRRHDTDGISIRRSPFRPHPEMNDSYFLSDE